jgi:hypothetical protein
MENDDADARKGKEHDHHNGVDDDDDDDDDVYMDDTYFDEDGRLDLSLALPNDKKKQKSTHY